MPAEDAGGRCGGTILPIDGERRGGSQGKSSSRTPFNLWRETWYDRYCTMRSRGPIAQSGLELPAHNRLVPGSNPGGPIPPTQDGTIFLTDDCNARDARRRRFASMNRLAPHGGRIA